MANFRMIKTDFWNDEKVGEFTLKEKFFWLFLLTNPETTQLGVYKISKRKMTFYTGISEEEIEQLLEKFETEYKLLKYSSRTNEIAIKNFFKHNTARGGKPWYDMLIAEMKKVSNIDLLAYIYINLEVNEKPNNFIIAFFDELYNYISNKLQNEEIKIIINKKNQEIRSVTCNDTYHDTYHVSYELTDEDRQQLDDFYRRI